MIKSGGFNSSLRARESGPAGARFRKESGSSKEEVSTQDMNMPPVARKAALETVVGLQARRTGVLI